jgi:hypothetical protein
MAELMQLDKVASLVGKSEVTIRRLIKAGKIPFQKEKTLTGFIYLVDVELVRAYYQAREGTISGIEEVIKPVEHGAPQQPGERTEYVPRQAPSGTQTPVRIPIAGESGDLYEYWQKKSDRYEGQYNEEVVKHAKTREDLGVWRGRAEQSQAMLVKLLPSPSEVEVRQAPVEQVLVRKDSNMTTAIIITGLVILLMAAIGALVYVRYIPH